MDTPSRAAPLRVSTLSYKRLSDPLKRSPQGAQQMPDNPSPTENPHRDGFFPKVSEHESTQARSGENYLRGYLCHRPLTFRSDKTPSVKILYHFLHSSKRFGSWHCGMIRNGGNNLS